MVVVSFVVAGVGEGCDGCGRVCGLERGMVVMVLVVFVGSGVGWL